MRTEDLLNLIVLVPATAGLAVALYSPAWVVPVLQYIGRLKAKLKAPARRPRVRSWWRSAAIRLAVRRRPSLAAAAKLAGSRSLPLRWRLLRYHLGCAFCQCLVCAPLLFVLPRGVIYVSAIAALATWMHRVVAVCTTCGQDRSVQPMPMPPMPTRAAPQRMPQPTVMGTPQRAGHVVAGPRQSFVAPALRA